jgi:hypothetical protein
LLQQARTSSAVRRLFIHRPPQGTANGSSAIRRYVVLQQTHRADGWLSEIVSGDGDSLDCAEIGTAVPLHKIYLNAGLPDVAEP